MIYSFPRYLNAKRSVDDRALNQGVWSAFTAALSEITSMRPPRLLELGAGTGTMLQRLAEQGFPGPAAYHAIDALAENVACARADLSAWAARRGLPCARAGEQWAIEMPPGDLSVQFEQADLLDFLARSHSRTWDVVIANAFLDLFHLPTLLPKLLPLVQPGGWFLFTINFDGLTLLEPPIHPALDEHILNLYHRSMDERLSAGQPSGDSRTGRHLFMELPRAGYEIIAAGSSDWVVFPRGGRYLADEAYFLNFMLHFFEESLTGHAELDAGEFSGWLAARRAQIDRGELVLVAHQLDFLARRPFE